MTNYKWAVSIKWNVCYQMKTWEYGKYAIYDKQSLNGYMLSTLSSLQCKLVHFALRWLHMKYPFAGQIQFKFKSSALVRVIVNLYALSIMFVNDVLIFLFTDYHNMPKRNIALSAKLFVVRFQSIFKYILNWVLV